jgi:hypothetical protein
MLDGEGEAPAEPGSVLPFRLSMSFAAPLESGNVAVCLWFLSRQRYVAARPRGREPRISPISRMKYIST